MSNLLELRPKPARKPLQQSTERHPESTAASPRTTPTRKQRPLARPLQQKLPRQSPSDQNNLRRSKKLQKYKRTSNLELIRRSVPAALLGKKLSHRLYIDGVAFPARHIGSLAVVWQEGQGYQLFSWELRSPVSSRLFETFAYCFESAVELQQRFDVDRVLELQPFGSVEKIDAMIQIHQMREQIATEQA